MKIKLTHVLLFLSLIVFLPDNHAHSTTIEKSNDTSLDYSGVSLLGVGLSIGYYSYGFFGTRSVSVPPLNVYYELGIHEYITAGPFGGYARWDYRYSNSDYAWTFYQIGARGSFHLTSILNEVFGNTIDEDKIDWYIAIMSGLEIRSFSSNAHPDLYSNRNRIFFGPTAGVRYYLGSNFALYLEGGRGSLGALTFGISTRF